MFHGVWCINGWQHQRHRRWWAELYAYLDEDAFFSAPFWCLFMSLTVYFTLFLAICPYSWPLYHSHSLVLHFHLSLYLVVVQRVVPYLNCIKFVVNNKQGWVEPIAWIDELKYWIAIDERVPIQNWQWEPNANQETTAKNAYICLSMSYAWFSLRRVFGWRLTFVVTSANHLIRMKNEQPFG